MKNSMEISINFVPRVLENGNMPRVYLEFEGGFVSFWPDNIVWNERLGSFDLFAHIRDLVVYVGTIVDLDDRIKWHE